MSDPTPETAETPTRFQCRHIFADGHRCAAASLRLEEFCYFHHATRRPIQNPRRRRSRQSTFTLPVPEDRSSIQLSLGEVISRVASNSIDPRRASLLLYALQIASTNLPRLAALKSGPAEPCDTVDDITLDPNLGPVAPRAVLTPPERKKTLGEFVMEAWYREP
jgi:hypothetical protein